MIVAPMDESVQHALGLRECTWRTLPLVDYSFVVAAASRFWFAATATGVNTTARATVPSRPAKLANARRGSATNKGVMGASNMPCARAVGAPVCALPNK